ncbi:glycosyltransferase family 4 protein [Oscillochloris sp. ZM17-4]|uniref:glycosyltransferase family 4 protein n=1 Tax=Oscillochloris sp. ZM17-4 TaxID=2866714 RepID=UPI001C73D92A|nr:glycosyltransferase family 4 protein [Oscillochloris sp. ZM17-4]MBX0326796.1 glycosyltransferase family 4 protein [Oscillochloris sp. ZM17-4]
MAGSRSAVRAQQRRAAAPLRIAFLTGEYPPQPGGVGDYTRQLGRALAADGHQVVAITMRDGCLAIYDQIMDRPDLAEPSFVTFQMLRDPRPLTWSPRSWRSIRTAIHVWHPDWLHIQYQTGAYAMSAGVNLLPRYLRLFPERPQIAVTFHDLLEPYLFPKAGPLRAWVNRRLAADADAVVATNAADADRLAAMRLRGPALATIPIGSNIAVAPPPGYRRAAWRERLGVGPGELLVAYFGLLSRSKGADLLVEALSTLDSATPWRLLIVGGAAIAPQDVAFAAELEAQIARLGLGQRVIRTGHVDAADVSAHLLAADCAALPFRDGASLRRGSLLAALAHGCPLLTSAPADAETAAALGDGAAAMLTPPGDCAALAESLARIAASPDLRADLAAAGRAAAAPFGWPQIARQHAMLYGRDVLFRAASSAGP